MAGFWTVVGKIAEHILSPAQRRRAQIAKIEKEMDALMRIPGSVPPGTARKYSALGARLRQLQKDAQNQ